jgi:hypothetical protein
MVFRSLMNVVLCNRWNSFKDLYPNVFERANKHDFHTEAAKHWRYIQSWGAYLGHLHELWSDSPEFFAAEAIGSIPYALGYRYAPLQPTTLHAALGNVDILWNLLQLRFPVSDETFREAARHNQVGCLMVLLCDLTPEELETVKNPALLLQEYAVSLSPINTIPPDTANLAAMHGSLDVIQLLNAWKGFLSLAERDVDELFFKVPKSLFSSETMDLAAKHGHLSIVQYLHHNSSEGCTENAMTLAAWNNHLDVVKFLHRNRSEGCRRYAADVVCANGHLEMLKYLLEVRKESCTELGLKWAMENGHVEVGKYLLKRSDVNVTEQVFLAAVRWGQLESVTWILDLDSASKWTMLPLSTYTTAMVFCNKDGDVNISQLLVSRAPNIQNIISDTASYKSRPVIGGYLYTKGVTSK